jgi:hypothetical protein
MVAYGLAPWVLIFQTSPLTDLPAMLGFLFGLSRWLEADANPRRMVQAGIALAISWMMRFDMLLLILPLAVLTPRGSRRYILGPLAGAAALELLLDVAAYRRFVYAPWEFLQVNLRTFVKPGPFDALAAARTWFAHFPVLTLFMLASLADLRRRGVRLLWGLMILFLLAISYVQPFEPRIFVVKLLPIAALLAGSLMHLLQRWEQRLTLTSVLFRGSALAALVFMSLVRVARINYPARAFNPLDCVRGQVCSNYPSAVEYHCRVKTTLMKPTPDEVAALPSACDYFVYFKDISSYNLSTHRMISQTSHLVGENTAAWIYRLPN